MAADESVRAELAVQFNSAVSEHEDVMAECKRSLRTMGLTA